MKYIDLSKHSDSVYRIAEIIASDHYNNILVYEFHNAIDGSSYDNYEAGLDSFRERVERYNSLFIPHYLVDRFAAIIGVAVKISNEWLVIEDAGSNFYLGYGPRGIIDLRKACSKKGIRIFYFDDLTIQDWMSSMGFVEGKTNIKTSDIDNIKIQKEAKFFKKIVNAFAYYSMEIQNGRSLYQNIPEEEIRDRMMPTLAGVFRGQATAETKRGRGYTDILIKSDKYPFEFIFELKKWQGVNALEKAIIQLVSYTAYHHNYLGLVLYCYNNNFTSIMMNAQRHLEDLYELEQMDSASNQQLRIISKDDSDSLRKIKIHIFFVNLFLPPQPSASRP